MAADDHTEELLLMVAVPIGDLLGLGRVRRHESELRRWASWRRLFGRRRVGR